MRLRRSRKRLVTRREKRRVAKQRAHFVRTYCRRQDYAPLQMGADYAWGMTND